VRSLILPTMTSNDLTLTRLYQTAVYWKRRNQTSQYCLDHILHYIHLNHLSHILLTTNV
jgi:hypothetical protein